MLLTVIYPSYCREHKYKQVSNIRVLEHIIKHDIHFSDAREVQM